MKYLLHSCNATFNATTKRWIFTLDQHIMVPKVMTVDRAHFTCTTATSPFPDVVYMRSDAIARMMQRKHTVQLQSGNHIDDTNILAVMTETHARGRYAVGKEFREDPMKSRREIDIYFTDGCGTVLEGEYSAGSGGTGTTTTSATDGDIELINDLLMWIDYDSARTLDSNFAGIAGNVGDNFKYIYPRVPSDGNLVFIVQNAAGNDEMELALLGAGPGMRQETPNASGWYMMDSVTSGNPILAATWQLHHTFMMPATLSPSTGSLFDVGELILGYEPSGQWFYYNSSNQKTILNTTWIPLRSYLLSVSKEPTGAQGAHELHFRFEDLLLGTVVDEVVSEGPPANGQVFTWVLGHAGYWFSHVAGPYLMANGLDTGERDDMRSWLKEKYDTNASTTTTTTTVTSEDATFFTQLTIR